MATPTVSAIIPLFNKGRYIQRAVSSVLAQTFPPLEIIVVDDGSADDGPEKVLCFGDPRISLIRQPNRGPGAARNAGLAIAKSKYIAFLDADDEWLPSFLERGVSLLEDETARVAAVWTGYYRAPSMKRNADLFGELSGVYEIGSETTVKMIRQIIKSLWTCSAIMSTDVAKKWGGFYDHDRCLIGEDTYLFLKLLFNERIGVIPEPLGIYHMEASSLSGGERKTPLPPSPYLTKPAELIATCHPNKRAVLRKTLILLALGKIISLAECGREREAQRLLDGFHREVRLSGGGLLAVRVLIRLAPALQIVRQPWHFLRRIAKCENADDRSFFRDPL